MSTATATQTRPMLMSTETEYSVAGTWHEQEIAKGTLHVELTAVARKQYRCLPDASNGSAIYLENGSRLYLDCGDHPELAQPEVPTPREVAFFDKAGERLMARAAQQVMETHPGMVLSVVKNNVAGFAPDAASWAQHSSFMCWTNLHRVADQIMSHLVTQLPFAGVGFLSEHPRGFGFELSQRARHFKKAIGQETTHDRPIFCTRIRKRLDHSNQGWVRAHMINKDSQRMPFGVYLSFATTGLIFHHLNQRRKFDKRLALADPVQSIREVSVDPWLKTRLKLVDGRELTPIEIQYQYLEQCERFNNSGNGPDWGKEAVRHWRETLETLERNPMQLANRLDPYMKLALFNHELQRAHYTWPQLRTALGQLFELRQHIPPQVISAILAGTEPTLPPQIEPFYRDFQARHNGINRELLRFAGRMQVLEHQYHTLGGLYDRLEERGHIDPVILSEADVQRAVTEPPQGSRAAVRSQCIREYHNQRNYVCDWAFIMNTADHTIVDLDDPFETEVRIVRGEQKPVDSRSLLRRILG